jgi:hypothetical protein
MPTHLLALVPSVVLVVADVPRAETAPLHSADRVAQSSQKGAGGIRTDRLSRKQLQVWRQIVAVVMAEDRSGQPLHPTLRQLWDAVDTSGHIVQIDMSGRKGPPSYLGGRFAVTKVDPGGRSHEAVLGLNLRGIDGASTKPMAARADGFIPFEGLGRIERYAEVLGHELAHAVWHFADPERARLEQGLEGKLEDQARRIVAAGVDGPGQDLRAELEELDRFSREVEAPAEAAEKAIWKELQAAPRPRR